jgi:hypothetical protein
MISDEDDMFQEACYWLLDSIWEWDSSRNTPLSVFVVYNIGARLAGIVKNEKNIKRHPEPNGSWRVDLWGPVNKDDSEGNTIESCIPSTADIELAVAIRQAIIFADDHMSTLAQELTCALIETDGNFADAVRMMAPRKHIKKRFGTEESHLKYALRFKVLPEISHFFRIEDIILT